MARVRGYLKRDGASAAPMLYKIHPGQPVCLSVRPLGSIGRGLTDSWAYWCFLLRILLGEGPLGIYWTAKTVHNEEGHGTLVFTDKGVGDGWPWTP
jgi:hypothetical protein